MYYKINIEQKDNQLEFYFPVSDKKTYDNYDITCNLKTCVKTFNDIIN